MTPEIYRACARGAKVACGRIRRFDLVEDATQEAAIKIWQAGITDTDTAFRFSKRRALDWLRTATRYYSVDMEVLVPFDSNLCTLATEAVFQQIILYKILDQLKPLEREVVERCVIGDERQMLVAAEHHVDRSYITHVKTSAMRKLRESLVA